jgi:hypothetical protein
VRLPFIAVAAVVLVLVACNGPTGSTPEFGLEGAVAETPEATEPSPSDAPPTQSGLENTLVETPQYSGVIVS